MPTATATLDSRFLRVGDCFAHRFTTPGTFRYALSPLPSPSTAAHDEPPRLAVVVAAGGPADESAGAWTGAPAGTFSPADAAGRTRTVTISSAANGTLDASPAALEVTAGDLVVWGADNSVPFGFRVRGELGEQTVDSGSMESGSVFSHSFGRPGAYEWADANGSGLHGRVDVVWPAATFGADDVERWLAALQEGALVRVTGTRAEPAAVQVIVGQTVVWVVERAHGVTVTDRSMLPFGPVAAGAVSPRRGRRSR